MTEIEALLKKFKDEFERDAEICVVVPGRVNIIGEHVDYSGFPVLPMALQRCVMVAAASDTSGDPPTLRLANADPNHPPTSVCLNTSIKIDYLKEGWSCYFLCGVKGALECQDEAIGKGMVAMVSGSVPPGAGLSSSSALVCAAFLTTTSINKIEMSMEAAAVECASCERYIGTEGGGMDQAIALLASSGCAKLVEFEPKLEAVNVCLPEDAVFVVAHSQATKNKAASSEFNTRVVECRLAAQILAKNKGILKWKNVRKLKSAIDQLGVALADASALVNEVLPNDIYTKAQVCAELGVSEETLDQESLSHNTRQVQEFKLRQRALHVYQEAQRVYMWKEAAEAKDLDKMGQLMNQSHESLCNLYECSHPQVDSLVQACLAAGAIGARITGAGWGGCIVALTTKDNVDNFISKVKSTYYGNKPCDDLIFPTSPASGAVVHNYSPS